LLKGLFAIVGVIFSVAHTDMSCTAGVYEIPHRAHRAHRAEIHAWVLTE